MGSGSVQNVNSIAIGKFTASTGTSSIAIGTSAEAAGANAIAIGQGAGGVGGSGLGNRSIEISTRTNQSRVGNVDGQLVFNTSSSGTPGNVSTVVSDFIVQTTGLATGVGVQPGGLLDVAGGGGAVSAPTTADFDHYLVYNSRTGQIRICPV